MPPHLRFVALLTDLALMGTVILIWGGWASLMDTIVPTPEIAETWARITHALLTKGLIIAIALFYAIGNLISLRLSGGTFGMLLLGFVVLDDHAEPLEVQTIVLRYSFGWSLSLLLLPFSLAAGYMNKRMRMIHDLIASCRVVVRNSLPEGARPPTIIEAFQRDITQQP